MNNHKENRGKSLYSASLSAENISFCDSPSSNQSIKLQDFRSNFRKEHSKNLQDKLRQQKIYQGKLIFHKNMIEEDSDWDSEPELEIVQIQEALRIHRRIPSIHRNKSTISKNSIQPQTNSKIASSPYYCEEICPQLDFGYQWPQTSYDSHNARKQKGFVRVTPSNTAMRQRQIDRLLLTRRDKIKKDSLLLAMTIFLKDTYSANNSNFAYDQSKIPKRILTKPSRPVRNENHDNENFDYILKVNEILGEDPNHQYRVIDLLGQGTFGQVVKCERISTGELCSVKVIKNKSAYKTQSCMEIEILKKLNTVMDPEDKHHILRLHYVFPHKNHLCLVFELLSYNLYDLIGHNRYKGFPSDKVRAFAVQILDTLCLLKEAKIIHCDLKPENILLTSEKSLTIKVIDFGSSCHEANRIYTYIQSRFYRSPEVLLGMRYTGAIDMWSFGCIVAELFLGLPLFPGSSEYNQLFRIVEMLGVPSKDMLSKGRNTHVFFNKKQVGDNNFEYELKSCEQYSQENSKNELPRKKYFPQTTLKDIILMFNNGNPVLSKEEERKRGVNTANGEQVHLLREQNERQQGKYALALEMEARLCILDFLYGVLELNPLKRWTPFQALQHPFITQKPFTGPFKPDSHTKPVSTGSASSTTIESNDKPVSFNKARRRAESMGKPTAPEQIQTLAKQIQKSSPISKYKKEPQQTQQYVSEAYRQRNTRSQGDYVGLVIPSSPDKDKQGPQKKVKIASQIKLRRGSHDSMRTPPHDGQTVRSVVDGRAAKIGNNVRKAYAGEAAGGLLMMRQQEKSSSSSNNKRNIMVDAFKRRK
ncbi:dual specificity protein kinase yak1 [Rhizopus stolonifer]|uniref:Dual specificity protein kinase yak1 n=1 Tax=Rhizopus stolonifer TaxID=4846 RepID=A0A367JHB8_RHIST|nr:dual specificity protein kinase yak1 [Rhizopus stolonifer]